jgi:D-3-phosphoglycerate dehydrogenase / 2-oxoglutarate reductase
VPLKTLFVPGPYDALSSRLKGALGPDANLSSLDYWTPSDKASQIAGRSDVLVLGPGAEAASELASADSGIRLVQFTGCHQPYEDVGTLQADGLTVTNAGPALAPFVAENTMELIDAALKSAGNSTPSNDLVVGIVGLGNVGIEVARRVHKMGARIVYHDIRTVQQGFAAEVGARRQSLDRVLLDSDVITVHVSDTPHTPEMIGDREFKLLKPGAVLVNSSLSSALDEDALIAALASGKVGAAALGVITPFPDNHQNPLLEHPSVVTDLDLATEREVALKAIAALVADNIKRFEVGEQPVGLIETIGFPGVGDPAFWSSHLAPRQTD